MNLILLILQSKFTIFGIKGRHLSLFHSHFIFITSGKGGINLFLLREHFNISTLNKLGRIFNLLLEQSKYLTFGNLGIFSKHYENNLVVRWSVNLAIFKSIIRTI